MKNAPLLYTLERVVKALVHSDSNSQSFFQRSQFPKGFTIIIIPLSTDKDCMTTRDWSGSAKGKSKAIQASNPKREKIINISIRATIQYDLPWMFGLQLLGIFFPCILLTMIVFCSCDRRLK